MQYPCPCCGFLVFPEPPGSHLPCPICCWEDDVVQLRWPTWGSGANRPSLVEAQRNFGAQGSSDPRLLDQCQPVQDGHARDPAWRPVNLIRDRFERTATAIDWPDDFTRLYYWRPDFWLLERLRRGADGSLQLDQRPPAPLIRA